MGSRWFYINIIIRITLILFNCFFLVVEFERGIYVFTIINLGLLLLLQVLFLFWYINRVSKKVIQLLDFIKSRDSGLTTRSTTSRSTFGELERKFAETRKILQDISIENEIKKNYLQFIIDYVDVGLLSFDNKGIVSFINPTAKKILGRKFITNIKRLDELNDNFSDTLQRLKPGESDVLVVKRKDDAIRVSINVGLFNIMGTPYKLISFQDIDKHLYKQEIESWSKIIRILNHEIMNSITPITSLSKTMKGYFIRNNETIQIGEISPKVIDRTIEGLGIIEERGTGLINFVNSYRKLATVPEPVKITVQVRDQLLQVKNLMSEETSSNRIDLSIDVQSENLTINVDKEQIQQVLINLVKNAIQALTDIEKPKIILRGFQNENGSVIVQVEDNGVGIPEEMIDIIFIPYLYNKRNWLGDWT